MNRAKLLIAACLVISFVLAYFAASMLKGCQNYCESKRFAYSKIEQGKCYCGIIRANGTIEWFTP
jgi:hypothetical protein